MSFKKKKLVLTANIHDVEKIDHALSRPGRCFDVMRFRPMTKVELGAAAGAAGVTAPAADEATLGELFERKRVRAGTQMTSRRTARGVMDTVLDSIPSEE